jgi:hypothetical protein
VEVSQMSQLIITLMFTFSLIFSIHKFQQGLVDHAIYFALLALIATIIKTYLELEEYIMKFMKTIRKEER